MKKHILLIIFTFLLIPTLVVFANPKDKEDDLTQPAVLLEEKQGDIAKCNNVTKKVEMITERYDQNKKRYINAFQNIHRSMEKFALKFKADGYDTVQLEAHITEFNNMIQNAIRSYNEFRVGLENAKGEACGGDDKEAQQEFTQARKELKDFKDTMLDLRTYVKETLRQDIMDLRGQITDSQEDDLEEEEKVDDNEEEIDDEEEYEEDDDDDEEKQDDDLD